jgi:hypothetical protein
VADLVLRVINECALSMSRETSNYPARLAEVSRVVVGKPISFMRKRYRAAKLAPRIRSTKSLA